ncbi:DUF4381 family protein [Halopseudomonas salegens]|uniref:PEP-CTERM protein-sorting domain-containing protein n=1 Tax=Halopseudomonas salegens TaxID=1434072 RepID=A0A1H2EYS3_9GAMM|nr:DUF4381 family protein [Halopseudomonas salegens]SDU00189.1 PEP-CTERM protein-sorting domain-containing protein [Halopseudomonas salegens]
MSSPLQQALIPPIQPEPIAFWPLAPGWWLLLLAVLTTLLLLSIGIGFIYRRQQRQRQAARWLEDVDPDLPDGPWLTELNLVLKRACKQQGHHAAMLYHGNDWLDYLCARRPQAQRDLLQPLADGHYQPGMQLDLLQRQLLLQELRRWLRHTHG